MGLHSETQAYLCARCVLVCIKFQCEGSPIPLTLRPTPNALNPETLNPKPYSTKSSTSIRQIVCVARMFQPVRRSAHTDFNQHALNSVLFLTGYFSEAELQETPKRHAFCEISTAIAKGKTRSQSLRKARHNSGSDPLLTLN